MDDELSRLSTHVGHALSERQWLLTCAESCTGGWVSEVITATAGSSNWFERGFVTYSNAAKQDMLGVSADTLAQHGAVSEPTVLEMRRAHSAIPPRKPAWPSAVLPAPGVAHRVSQWGRYASPGA